MSSLQILEDLQDMIDNGDEEEQQVARQQLEIIDRLRKIRENRLTQIMDNR